MYIVSDYKGKKAAMQPLLGIASKMVSVCECVWQVQHHHACGCISVFCFCVRVCHCVCVCVSVCVHACMGVCLTVLFYDNNVCICVSL